MTEESPADQQFTEEDVQRIARALPCPCSEACTQGTFGEWATADEGERLVRSILAALVEDGWRRESDLRREHAVALRAYADRHHAHAEGVAYPTDYGTGVEYDAFCSGCGAAWYGDEDGCTERAQLLKDAAEALAEPVVTRPEGADQQ